MTRFSGLYPPDDICLQLKEHEAGDKQLREKRRQLLMLLSPGYSNADMGGAVELAESSVKFHGSRIYNVLDMANRTEGSAEAHRLGIIE